MAVDVRMPAGEARGGRRQSVPALILLSLFIVGALVLAACFAGWIAPPRVGIDNKPGDFEYVKLAMA